MSDMPPPPPPPEFEPGSSSSPPPPDPPQHSPQAATGWATLGTGQTVELAGPGARLGARVLDVVIMAVVFFVLMFVGIFAAIGAETEGEAVVALGTLLLFFLVIAIIGIAYEVSMIALKGQTLGKMATSVKVVRADNGELVGWGKSIGRWIIPAVLYFIPVVGPLLALLVYVSFTWDNTRQGWHDKAAGTLVIKT